MEASSSTSHFDAFASILRAYDGRRSELQEAGGDEETLVLLDDDEGIALRFAGVLEGILESRLSASSTENSTEEEISSLSLELSTWSLIHTLYSERLLPPPPSPSPESLLSLNPYTPPLTLIQHIISQDPELSEWQTIHSHLMVPQKGTSPFGVVERKEGYWAQTAGMVRRSKMAGGGGAGAMGRPTNLVGSLDPDAPSRPYGVRGGGELGAEDSNRNLSLLPALFSYLRYGRAEDCAALCRANDQSWRGASLVGGGSGWWIGGLAAKDPNEMDDEDELDIEKEEQFEIGNRNRALWKKIGRSVASNTKLPVYERALYGTLTGYLPAVLPVCRSWEDHVWAHINARIEARIDRRLSELGGFWAEEFGVAEPGDGEGEGTRVGGGLEDVFHQVMKTERDGVAAAARNPYRMAMTHVILGRTDELFIQFANSLDGMKDVVSPDLYPPLLRFFAHLVIYLRLLHQDPPLEPANIILQAYLDVLEEEGKSELVAVYAASLGEQNGATSYARFLKAMNPRATKEERKVALLRAKEHGLDLVEVAKLTVDLVMNETFMSMPGRDDPEPDVTDFSTRVIEGGPDWVLIRSLEWLTVSEETYPEALIQANNLVRFFLAYGKVHAAKELLILLPQQLYNYSSSSSSTNDDEIASQASEYMQHVMLFEVLGILTRCAELGATKPKANTLKIDQFDWLKSFTSTVDKAHLATVDLLKSSWLKLDLDGETMEDERRLSELARIRHIFVPELVFRLHNLLFETRELIPGNLQKVLELPNLLADERFELFVEFIQSQHNRLPAYLSLVRRASLECLVDATPGNQGNQDPFNAPSSSVST
ncbi:nuclear pore protein 84/107 [Mrakia frigida]|uniref:Nup84p n=1 Tax=Mrakia frigida TaxID=29902 RepID=UPI003FCBF3A2